MVSQHGDGQMHASLIRFRPPRIAMFMLAFAAVWQWALPLPAVEFMSYGPLANVLGIAGFAIMIGAWWQFRVNSVAVCPTEATALLITDGFYRYSRNPMYLGMLLMLGGVAMWIGTLPFVTVVVAFFLVIDLAFCPYEEQKLVQAFGDEYRRYTGKVRRWI